MEKSDYILDYALKQQTPLIHFQHDEVGATLRASEVKPKLDRFLIGRLGDGDYGRGLEIAREHKWTLGEHNALNYKMHITAEERDLSHPVVVFDENGNPKGGVGGYFFTERDINKIKQDSYYKKISVKLICGAESLRTLLSDRDGICAFFATHNFGLRQDKGFGSFIIEQSERQSRAFACSAAGFVLELQTTDTTYILNTIRNFWQLVKSGINRPNSDPERSIYKRSFLMKECFSGQLNDKKAMKLALINTGAFKLDDNRGKGVKYYDDDQSSKCCKMELFPNSLSNAEYIRGLLGFAGFYTFRNIALLEAPGKKFSLTFTVDGGEIQRFPAPVLFKPIIVDDQTFVYLILNQNLLNQLDGKTLNLKCALITNKDLSGRNWRNEAEKEEFCCRVNEIVKNIPPISLTIPHTKDFLNNFFARVIATQAVTKSGMIRGKFKYVQ